MFNHHQQNGGISPQMIQMQRLIAANRGPRAPNFMSADMQMNTPAELNDRRFQIAWPSTAQHQQRINMAAQQQQQQQNLLGFHGRTKFIPMIPPPMNMNSMPPTTSAMTQMGSSGFIGNSGLRMPIFRCPECNIVKSSSEDLEIHIKTEHLNWLPFICPLCQASRASDIQMREHMHSAHKKNENKYFYHDNPQAKKVLQETMDKALFGASNHMQNMKKRTYDETPVNGGGANIETVKKARLADGEEQRSKKQNEDAVAKQPQKQTAGGENNKGVTGPAPRQERQQSIDEETDAQLTTIFGRNNINVKSEFDMDGATPSPHHSMAVDEDDLPDDNSHQQLDVLQNVAKMFSASGGRSNDRQGMGRTTTSGNRSFYHPKRIVRNRPGPITSKKRVLGQCSRCHKPITAGARQMHMFFHLGKDMKTYRFRCRHPGCPVEHYRKDQMENHQSKAHGRVDPNMMDDRTQELYNLVQKMSMELLGTMGNTPGPTAAKAQQIYDQQLRDHYTNFGSTRRRTNNLNSHQSDSPKNEHGTSSKMFDSANRKIEDLECRICHKNIMSRIRGFHILWHLNNDLGIVRYGCKFCNYKHDRPQSVTAHGGREHGSEDCCEDLLYNFESDLKAMSKSCFGVERLFEKEIRRRSKLEREVAADGDLEIDEDDDSQAGSSNPNARRSARVANLKVPLKPESSDRSWSDWTPKEQVKKRRSLRRFGTRKIKSRRQKEEMIKLREVSMRLGGAQYFKKKTNEAVPCDKCGKLVTNRLSDHAYSHLDGCDLFRCQQCNLGHYSRETIVRHLRDFHNTSNEPPLDNRLRFAQEIKDAIRECYPRLFVDAPIPNKEDIEKLKANLKLKNMVLDTKEEGDEEKEEAEGEGNEDEEQVREEEDEEEGEMETTGNDEFGLNEGEEEVEDVDEEEQEEEEEEEEEHVDEEEEEEEEVEDDPDYGDEEEGDGEEKGVTHEGEHVEGEVETKEQAKTTGMEENNEGTTVMVPETVMTITEAGKVKTGEADNE